MMQVVAINTAIARSQYLLSISMPHIAHPHVAIGVICVSPELFIYGAIVKVAVQTPATSDMAEPQVDVVSPSVCT